MKAIAILWLVLLTIYAPIELSRLIVDYGLDMALTFELCVIWVFYLGAMLFLCKVVRV